LSAAIAAETFAKPASGAVVDIPIPAPTSVFDPGTYTISGETNASVIRVSGSDAALRASAASPFRPCAV
jgi:hypothetical protein